MVLLVLIVGRFTDTRAKWLAGLVVLSGVVVFSKDRGIWILGKSNTPDTTVQHMLVTCESNMKQKIE